ncbi:non-ribosomal peptide synthetase [Serratia symbiotica]|uniref:non-ribosomal peptide synthetase n=1 Tax=Serratia symbiotica TaxID=138074 RepID=UPI00136E2DDC|nr:non-ribosomal peptide synthetase [Serratia symbiotica]QTP15254.1 amino acid adenylation domain-containing protein [Serratia symbiotica]
MTDTQNKAHFSSALPLVAAQPGIWMAEQVAERSGTFTVAHYVEFHSEPNCALFDEAVRRGLADADMVHARFGENDAGEPVQFLCAGITPAEINGPEWLDFSQAADAETQALAWMKAEMTQPLSTAGEAPLWHQALIRVEAFPAPRWFWYQRFHHLLLDGFSFTALTAHIVAIYQALLAGEAPPASPFTSFAAVVEEYLAFNGSEAEQKSREFWLQHARDQAAPVSLALPEEIADAEAVLPLQQHCSLEGIDFRAADGQAAALLMAGLCLYFGRMSGERRLSFGVPFMRRMGSAALTAVGPVVNVLPLQLEFGVKTSLQDAATLLARELNTLRRHQRYEAEQLRRDLGLVGSDKGLYGPVLNYKVYHEELLINGQPTVTHTLSMGPVDDLDVEIAQHDDELHLRLVANPERYSQTTLQRHAKRIQNLLTKLFAEPEKPACCFSLLTDEEDKHIAAWSTGGRIAPDEGETSVLDWLVRRTAQTPDEIAVISGEQRLTWQTLHDRSMRLGRELIARGIGAEDVVALGLARSETSVVAIFGVLASGAAYLPLDMDYPAERLALMCEDARPALILASGSTASRLPSNFAICRLDADETLKQFARHASGSISDAERREPLHGDHLAYMIYTSGSTGKPKGVMSTHKGLLNLLVSHANRLFGPAIVSLGEKYRRKIRAGHTASFSFDSSWEPLFCMLMGAELTLFDEEMRRDAWAMVQFMRHTPVDIMDVTPSFLLQMIDSGLLEPEQPAPHVIMIGGETATPRLWEIMQANPQIAFYNYYGPSEYTIDTLGTAVSACSQPVIGHPVANTDVWLLDNQLQPVPVGVAGELYISGTGIARGYLRRPDLTATRFVANPFVPGEVMYRTGDLMRWRADGQLAFIGRVDHQIKVRGFRVELGEVESALAGLEDISGAVVIAQPHGASWRLVGYCAIADAERRNRENVVSELQSALAQQLPEYMVPGVLVVLDALPLTVNGKVDRQALPEPLEVPCQSGRSANTPQERLICQAMEKLLNLQVVSAEDDFFALGGDSIFAMSLGNQLRREGWSLRPKEIFAGRTPAAMARLMMPFADEHASASQRSGAVDSLPIMRWYNQQGQQAFLHGVWLNTPAGLTVPQLVLIMGQLLQAYPTLGATLNGESLLITQADGAEQQCQALAVDITPEQSAGQAFDLAISQIDPQAGRLWHAVLLEQNGRAEGVVLAIHHLVTDGVSWRLLLEALPAASQAVDNGTVLPASTGTSLVDWSHWLAEHHERYRAELPFWRSMLEASCAWPETGPLDPQVDTQATRGEIRTLLSPEHSAALLGSSPGAWRTRTDTLLLAALLLACRARTGLRELRVSVESHGRPDGLSGIDLSDCVGWLTAEYPLLLSLSDNTDSDALAAVRAVKEVVEAVKDYGVGFGVLRYLLPDDPLRELAVNNAAPVLFNYLGRLGKTSRNDWAPRQTSGLFRDTLAVHTCPQMPLSHLLEINIFAGQGDTPQIAIHWGFARRWLSEESIVGLSSAFEAAVGQLIQFAQQHPLEAQDTLVAAQTGIPSLTAKGVQALRNEHGAPADILPLLPLQQGLLFHVRTDSTVGRYNSLTRLTLQGELCEAQLARALNQVVARYPQLAARFDSENAPQPVQILPLAGDERLCWPLTCVTLDPSEGVEVALARHEQEELGWPLLEGQGPMLHARWVRHADFHTHSLFLTAHHLVVDGWSTPVITGDLMALLSDAEAQLPALPMPYGTLVRQLAARDAQVCVSAWAERLEGVSPTLLFAEQPDNGPVSTLTRTLSTAQEQAVNQLCRRYGLTLNTVMQGIWGMLLAIQSGNDDVVFGSPVSGRMAYAEALEQQVGLFSNTLPVRVSFDMKRPLVPQLQALQHHQIALLEHDNIGLADIQRQAGAGTLFDTLLVVENYPAPHESKSSPSVLHCVEIHNRGYTHYPATLLVLPAEGISLHLEYRPSLRDPQAWLDRFEWLLAQLIASPELPLWQWSLQTEEEAAFIHRVNQTAYAVKSETLYSAIQNQCAATPDALALQDNEHRLSWFEMHQQVCALAQRLRDAGVVPGDVVAVALPRSVRLSLALQAIVALGAAWLPLDVGYPDERLHLMLEDAKPRLVIASYDQAPRFDAVAVCLRFDDLAPKAVCRLVLPTVSPQQAAYVLYTSGSTGRPKGVVVSHEAIINRLRWMQAAFPLSAQDVVLQKTPSSFDVSVWEFFWPLMVGASLVMAPPDAHRDPEVLQQLIEDYRVTTLHFVPSMLATWIDTLMQQSESATRCASLRQVFCSGEALSGELARRFRQLLSAALHNLYGPTEAAVDVTWQPADEATLAQLTGPGVPIGKPVWNTQLRILDRWLRPVPPGAPGELWLSGIQLALEYLKRPDLTAIRFVADPFAPGKRMYRTGDIARWLHDGVVEYLGRTDDQLKIRGQRIEMGEIEQVLLSLPGIAQAAVAPRELSRGRAGTDNRQLVAWLIASGERPDPQEIQRELATRLPAHMVPVRYLYLEHFPLSPSGKLDRKALPMPMLVESGREMPISDAERRIASLFMQLLGVEQVYADDDFFTLGGHSLLAMQLALALRRQFERPITIGQVMAARNVRQLASLMDGSQQGESAEQNGAEEVLPLRNGEGAVLFCFHPASGFAWQYSGLLRYLSGSYSVIGLQSPRPGGVIASVWGGNHFRTMRGSLR